MPKEPEPRKIPQNFGVLDYLSPAMRKYLADPLAETLPGDYDPLTAGQEIIDKVRELSQLSPESMLQRFMLAFGYSSFGSSTLLSAPNLWPLLFLDKLSPHSRDLL